MGSVHLDTSSAAMCAWNLCILARTDGCSNIGSNDCCSLCLSRSIVDQHVASPLELSPHGFLHPVSTVDKHLLDVAWQLSPPVSQSAV